MKYGIFLLMLILACIAAGKAAAAPFEIIFKNADRQTLRLIEKLLPEDIAEAKTSPLGNGPVQSARVKISQTQAPYLFVLIQSECGAANCPVQGFQMTKGGWRKIFEGGGETFIVSSSSHGGHHDLTELVHVSVSEQGVNRYHWMNGRYQQVSSKTITVK